MVSTPIELDLRGVPCPLSWARARVRLDEMSAGQSLILLLDEPRSLRDIPQAAEAAGYAANEATPAEGYWTLVIDA